MAVKRGYDIIDTSFDQMDEDWKAYFLGLLMADGNLRGHRVNLKLHKDDAPLLDELRGRLGLTRPLSAEGEARTLYFASKSISDALRRFGMTERKTNRLAGIPPLSANLIPAFVRGFFDGDGTASTTKAKPHSLRVAICSVCYDFLVALQGWLSAQGVMSTIYKEKRVGKTLRLPKGDTSSTCLDMYSLLLPTFEDKARFFHLCWDGAPVAMPRKRGRLSGYVRSHQERHATLCTQGSYTTPWPDLHRRYMDGESVRNLAREYGVHWRSFYHWMKRVGHTPRQSGTPR